MLNKPLFEQEADRTIPGNIKDMDEEENEDITCCHRITIIHPRIRNILVTSPVFKRLGNLLTWSTVFHYVTGGVLITMGWAILYFLLGDTMLPKNDGFGLYFLAIFSHYLGWTLASIPYLKIPPVFGMLVAGLIIRNSGIYDIHKDLGVATTSNIRTFCLTFIMIRAGLQLSTTSLKNHPFLIMILALVPCTIEMLAIALCCRFILAYEWDWSFMTGCSVQRTIIGCMSPVVTLNCILSLVERGYGEDKGLGTVLCTAACIDDVHIVSLFVICYTIVFANNGNTGDRWLYYVLIGFRDFVVGALTGSALGIFFTFFPHRSHKHASFYRMMCLVLGSLICTTGTAYITVSGGGYFASLMISFVSMIGWKLMSASFDTAPFRRTAYYLWHLAQPILVGVIGADIAIVDWSLYRFGLHLFCILIGLTARSVAAYLSTARTSFTWKERLFVILCWIPKGSLQAALGPMAYERIRIQEDTEHLETALDVVKISVLTILLLAPIGAALINIYGPHLLEQATIEDRLRDRHLSYLRILSVLPVPSEQVK